MSDSLDYIRNSAGQNTGVGSCFLLQGIVPTEGLNPGLPHCGRILCCLSRWEARPTVGYAYLSFYTHLWSISCVVALCQGPGTPQ